MTKNHENKLTMYEAVQSLLDANSEKTAAVPAFAGTITKLKGTLQSIKSKATEVEGAAAGKVASFSNSSAIAGYFPLFSRFKIKIPCSGEQGDL